MQTYLEHDLSMTVRGIIIAIHPQGAHNLHPRGVHGDQDHALLLVGGSGGVSLAHENSNLAAGIWGSACPPLVSTHNVAVTVPVHHNPFESQGKQDIAFLCKMLFSGLHICSSFVLVHFVL